MWPVDLCRPSRNDATNRIFRLPSRVSLPWETSADEPLAVRCGGDVSWVTDCDRLLPPLDNNDRLLPPPASRERLLPPPASRERLLPPPANSERLLPDSSDRALEEKRD